MEIKLGTKILKPVITQAECDAYSAVVDAITAHNAAAAVGEALWSMDDQPEFYVVVEAAAKQKAVDTLPETLAALQSAQTDTDSLVVDQEYRLTMLELGVTPEE